MKLAVLFAALAVAPAFANDMVVSDGGNYIRLADSPCSSAQVLSHLPEQVHSQFRAASAVLQGQSYAACWRVMGNAAVLLYEDGDQGLVPLDDLKPGLSA